MCVLLLQIVETRVLSVISYYHLAFFAISMAMFGMTAGSLIAYFNQARFAPEQLLGHPSWIGAAFALAVVLSTVVLISTVLIDTSMGIILSAALWLKLIAALLPPYVFAGMGINRKSADGRDKPGHLTRPTPARRCAAYPPPDRNPPPLEASSGKLPDFPAESCSNRNSSPNGRRPDASPATSGRVRACSAARADRDAASRERAPAASRSQRRDAAPSAAVAG
jgi:hypothetical protein